MRTYSAAIYQVLLTKKRVYRKILAVVSIIWQVGRLSHRRDDIHVCIVIARRMMIRGQYLICANNIRGFSMIFVVYNII
jgi:hypothetical protein